MAEPDSLLMLVGNSTEACRTLSDTIMGLGQSVNLPLASLRPTAAECLTTRGVLERLGVFMKPLRPTTASTHGFAHFQEDEQTQNLKACFEVLVQSISSTLLDIDDELLRVRRYSFDRDPLAASKLVPVLRDSFIEASFNLRRNRSSLCLMLDCLESGHFSEATIQLVDLNSSLDDKSSETSRMQPRVAIGLHRYCQKTHIQGLMARFRPRRSKPHKSDPKLVGKLHQAIDKCDYASVYRCLSDKVDPNARQDTLPIHRALDEAELALSMNQDAMAKDCISIVTILVVSGADLLIPNAKGESPLILAVKGNMSDSIVSLMLELEARVYAADRLGNTALHYATMSHRMEEYSNLDIVKILLAYGADQSARNKRGRTPLHEAVSHGRSDRAEELLDYGGDIEAEDNNGWTPLFGAVIQGHVDLTQLLCDRGAFIDKKDKGGQTCLHYAISQGHTDVATILLEAGADANLISRGETPLCRATTKANMALIETLLEFGADAFQPSPGYGGALPAHLAAMGRDLGILEMLLEAGSPINGVDDELRTPLKWAMDGGKGELVHFLMNRGAET